MKNYHEFLRLAKEKESIAEHILHQTYPFLGEPKLLYSSLEHVFQGMCYAMEALLSFSYNEKIIAKIPSSFTSKLLVLDVKLSKRYKIDKRYFKTIKEINGLIILFKSCPVEFARRDALVICSEDYSLSTITKEKVEEYLFVGEAFRNKTEQITKRS